MRAIDPSLIQRFAAASVVSLFTVTVTACTEERSPKRPMSEETCQGNCCQDGCCVTEADFESCASSPQQEVITSDVVPKPLAGGTLLITRSGTYALASDPDRDRIVIVDLRAFEMVDQIPTPPGAEPGRLVEGIDGRVHVVLRREAAILTLDPTTSEHELTPACLDPRGIAVTGNDAASERLYLACAGGRLMTFTTSGHLTLTSEQALDPDLRDVVVSGDRVFVSHFRSSAIDVVAEDGQVVQTLKPAGRSLGFAVDGIAPSFSPTVAWRMVPRAEGGVWVVHQQSRSSVLDAPPAGEGDWGGAQCGAQVVATGVAAFDAGGSPLWGDPPGLISNLPLPVDIAVSRDATTVALVGYAADHVLETTAEGALSLDDCAGGPGDSRSIHVPGPVAAAYDADGNLLVQRGEPSELWLTFRLSGKQQVLSLGGGSRLDTGFDLFHGDPDRPTAPIACASCHPEGREDGHVWSFAETGLRRTQSLAGGVLQTAPFHWQGELQDLDSLMDEVFVARMGGMEQSPERIAALAAFIAAIPPAPRAHVSDEDAVQRGRALFESEAVGCAECHAGARLTSPGSFDVGTGAPFEVPSLLGLGTRAPFLHDGCAPTLAARFDPACGGADQHGVTSGLTGAQIADLVAYLESL